MLARSGAYLAFAGMRRQSRAPGIYSFFVRTTKVALPAGAAALLLMVFAWPETDDILAPNLKDEIPATLTIANMEAFGWDEDRPYSIRSVGVRRLGAEGQRFLMDRPKAWIVLPDGAWLSGTGESGVVDWTERTVRLQGEVRLEHESGFAINTREAFVNLIDKTASGDSPVEGEAAEGRFRAEGFRVLDGGNRIRLLGHASLSLDSKATSQ